MRDFPPQILLYQLVATKQKPQAEISDKASSNDDAEEEVSQEVGATEGPDIRKDAPDGEVQD